MTPARRPLTALAACALAGATGLAVPSPAAAARAPELLRDVAPAAAGFRDRVLDTRRRAARAARSASGYDSYAATADADVRIAVSSSYSSADTAALAQTYAGFLGSLVHGPELSSLRVFVGTPAEVVAACGGEAGVLACYDPSLSTMYVPGEQSAEATAAGVTTSYVVAHEYGHHVAANRSNAPFDALAYGPKRWASQELVCSRTLARKLAPGDEGDLYAYNPGEAWAETYAQLEYPGAAWGYTSLLAPDAASFAAARADVTRPWTRGRRAVYRGRLSGSVRRRSFSFALRLDGAASFRLRGPAAAGYDLRVTSNRRLIATTRGSGSRDSLAYDAACRSAATETVRVTVIRRSGRGAFRLAVAYAG